MNIYQYTDPKANGDDTRWIAAEDQEHADHYAEGASWRQCGGRILTLGGHSGATAADLRRVGCDVVLRYRNEYVCPRDGTAWSDTWSCMCNDRCPTCDDEIEPTRSVEA
jgi:hypothetical protein